MGTLILCWATLVADAIRVALATEWATLVAKLIRVTLVTFGGATLVADVSAGSLREDALRVALATFFGFLWFVGSLVPCCCQAVLPIARFHLHRDLFAPSDSFSVRV